MLSWQTAERRISIWTVAGRVKDVAFTAAPEQLATLALYRKGESDLVCRDGMWFLLATCEVPEAPLNTDPVDFLGIDLGIVNIATTSDDEILAGRELNRTRLRDRKLRTKLQRKNTPSARRRLKKRRRKEARRAKDINHKIAKHVVAEAERTGRGIALEDLTGIRERVRLRKPGGTSHALKAVGEGHPLQLVLCPAGAVHRVQGPQGRGAGGARRSGVHLSHLRRMRARRQGEPGESGLVRVPELRIR
jgi:transposase